MRKLKNLACLSVTATLVALMLAPEASTQGFLRQRLRERFAESGSPSSEVSGCETCKIAGLTVAVWQPQNMTGPVPLIIFSHGFRGRNQQSSKIMRSLADAGYLVMAPNHKDAVGTAGGQPKSQQPLGNPQQWTESTYKDRADDIRRLLSFLEQDAEWKTRIDWSKVALIGHSLGGYTVLGAAGGWPTWKVNGIKAVVALSPYANPFNQHGNIGTLNVPVMYQTGSRDIGVAPFLKGPHGCYSRTSSPAYLISINGANHFTWTNLNRDANRERLIAYYCISFLDKFVKGDTSAHPEKQLSGIDSVSVK